MNEKFCILIKISLRFTPKGPIDNKPSIGLDNGLAPNRRQAIIWTNADLIDWRIYMALGADELKAEAWMNDYIPMSHMDIITYPCS